MCRKRHSADEMVNKLGDADARIAEGPTVAQACKHICVTSFTYYRLR